MGDGTPYVAPAQPDPFAIAMAQQAQQQDISTTKSDLASQTAGLLPTFGLGSGISLGPRGASAAGALNGLPSIALMPLGAGR